MAILITGATGLVGKELVAELLSQKQSVHILTRNSKKAALIFPKTEQIKFFDWDFYHEAVPTAALQGVDRIIHLMGENIADKRWSNLQKAEILNSRVEPLKKIAATLAAHPELKIKKLVSTSAIGIYGHSDNLKFDEESQTTNQGFLSFVCQEWEKAAQQYKNLGSDVAILRVGIVLTTQGGALKKMLLPFKLGMGGILGSGQQWMSWIHIKDLVKLYAEATMNDQWSGVFNAVSPQPVSNKEFTKTLAEVLNRPSFLPAPAFAIKSIFGEMAQILLEGQQVFPKKALAKKFSFNYDKLELALKNLLA